MRTADSIKTSKLYQTNSEITLCLEKVQSLIFIPALYSPEYSKADRVHYITVLVVLSHLSLTVLNSL